MNNVKLCALVVMLCIIAPTAAGFAWPSSEATETIHEIGTYENITDDLYNGDALVYTNYNNYYKNNGFIYGSAAFDVLSSDIAANRTGAPTSVPNTYGITSVMTYPVDFGDDGVLEISNYRIWIRQIAGHLGIDDNEYIITLASNEQPDVLNPGITLVDANGTHFALSLQYDSYMATTTWFDTSNNPTVCPNAPSVTLESAYIPFEGHTPGVLDVEFIVMSLGSNGYVDITGGYKIQPNSTGYWENGYENVGFDVMVKTANNMSISFEPYELWGDVELTLAIANKVITLSDGTNTKTLGSSDVYPFVALNYNTIIGQATLYGLAGLNNFGAPYQASIRDQVTLDVPYSDQYVDSINYFSKIIMTTGLQAVDFLFTSTAAGTITVPAIVDKTLDLKSYSTGDSQITIYSVQQHPIGDALKIWVNGSLKYTGQATDDRMITINGESYPIAGLTISVIGQDVYVNGQALYHSSSSITSFEVEFKGSWMASVQYAKITDKDVPVFGWQAGLFGFDQSAFCMCGLITASGSGLAAMLTGRRSGAKTAMVSLTAICCAAVFLVLLMA